jgi:hypothetical protein
VAKEDSCPETTTTDERDAGDLAVEEESVALYMNMIPTHTGDPDFQIRSHLLSLVNSFSANNSQRKLCTGRRFDYYIPKL